MATKSMQITKDWQQVANGDCVVQSLFYDEEFCIAIGSIPSDTDAYVLTTFNEPCTLEFGQAVFIKLPDNYTGNGEKITVID